MADIQVRFSAASPIVPTSGETGLLVAPRAQFSCCLVVELSRGIWPGKPAAVARREPSTTQLRIAPACPLPIGIGKQLQVFDVEERMERSVEVLAANLFGVLGLSHILKPRVWAEFFLLCAKGKPAF